MKVELDIDGTNSEHPEFFADLSPILRASGHQVLVLAYRDQSRVEATKAQLAMWRIEYDELSSDRTVVGVVRSAQGGPVL